MKPSVKRFIEDNITLIEDADYAYLYEQADEWLTDDSIRELTEVLTTALNIDMETYAKANLMQSFNLALINYIHEKDTNLDALYLGAFTRLFMSTIYGVDFEEFQQMAYEYLETKPHAEIDYEIDGDGDILLRRQSL